MVKHLYKANGTTQDIIDAIVMVAKKESTDKRVETLANSFRGEETKIKQLKAIYSFVKQYIEFNEDPSGIQNIPAPHIVLKQRKCDSKGYAILISAVLKKLHISHSFMFVAQQKKQNFHHVYVVAHIGKRNFVIDPLMKKFNEEVEVKKRMRVPISEMENYF